ncbi:MAG: VCBS repeat-containing protein [Rhodospirillaceae bacterium]|jgi:hypothetical protein|nr:VCBS repeat-containing protein [Rhodospirillaceae bacterium]MBT4489361.1 VCBS repeat-containing protein [Rhodospirillaceae bacterium]MBT7759054.1 VCBS repeat-containing protein [Rhodospirillaceae bacterium]
MRIGFKCAVLALICWLPAMTTFAGMLRHQPDNPVTALFKFEQQIVAKVATSNGPAFQQVVLKNGAVRLLPLPDFKMKAGERRPDMLPDGIVTMGGQDISAAWLVVPTKRYDHGVLGDAIEAAGVRAQMRDGRVLSFNLPPDSVFEDRRVRLADLDGDGGDELLVVRSYLNRGAALAVLRPGPNELAIVAETPAIGLPYRWLNPAAVADFDGDGRVEIALVVTPHIGGTLKYYELRQNRLIAEFSSSGFSNHAMGSPIQDMAAVVDWGRGPILHLPDAWRGGLRQVSLLEGQDKIRNFASHNRPITTALVAADLDGDGWKEIVYGLDNGELVVFSR